MTLLASKVRFFYRCETGHRFERGRADAFKGFCPKCGMTIRLYGLADSTLYAEEPDDRPLEDLQGS